jgi:oligopeptide/dipeptide ABC transporter ATP-binding protein
MTELLEVVGLRTEIRTRKSIVKAVDGVSFSIRAGEAVGLVGESGSGKSMTGMSLMRLLPHGGSIAGGSVKLNGRELTSLSEQEMRDVRGNKIGMVYQDPMTALNPTMTVGEQVAEPIRVHLGLGKRASLERAAELLDLVGVPKPSQRLKDYPHQLSGGLRQRAVIAMALACEPDLLIADEPTTALDVSIQAQILGLLGDLIERLNMGLLLITHDMGVVADRTDRVMVMYAGQIVESSDTWTLFNDLKHPYAEALLDSIPHMDMDRGETLYSIPGMPPDLSDPPKGCRFAPRCRYAEDQCLDVAPTLRDDGDSHSYACFYPVHRVVGQRSSSNGDSAARVAAPTWRAPKSEGAAEGPLLVVNNVVKEFPIRRGILRRKVGAVQAVTGVSLEVARGETFGLVGESGSGKTTLGRLIMALEKPDSGSVSFDGERLSNLKGKVLRRKRREFQLMFQDPYASLDPRMRVLSILREPLASQGIGSRDEQNDRIAQLLHEVGLSSAAVDLYPHQFSGGQRQRIGLARALMIEPRLIVADEPVSALDVSIRSQVLNMMKRIQSEHGLTYLVISHDLSVVRYLADRIGVLYLGKLVEIGNGDDVYLSPAHPYTAGLLDSIPAPAPTKPRVRRPAALSGELPSASSPPSGCRFRTRCPRAQEICGKEEPVMRPFNESGHMAACHFPLQTPLQIRSVVVAEIETRSVVSAEKGAR